jgi:hypothetical protein
MIFYFPSLSSVIKRKQTYFLVISKTNKVVKIANPRPTVIKNNIILSPCCFSRGLMTSKLLKKNNLKKHKLEKI